ncbi:hypothetical protein [Streptomyces sp. HUAS TT7]|uniref:hypothetical protein n=1 Tax=Streptomyces sp. HUAS TT7 TaxID=3447507 RepID=UPI003F65DF53
MPKLLAALAPFLTDDVDDAVLSPKETAVFNDLRIACGYGDTDEANRLRTQARSLTRELVQAQPRRLTTTEAGWALFDALRVYAAGTVTEDSRDA